MGADRRPHRLLRPHREAALADPAEHRHRQDREAVLPRRRSTRRSRRSSRKDGRKVYFSALRNAIGDIFEIDLETDRGPQPDVGRVCRLRAGDLAGRVVPRVHGARSAATTSCSASISSTRQQDAADLRHARRGGRAVPRRRHARLPVHGRRPGGAGGPGGGQERPDLQPVDARPQERRAEAVHRRAHEQPVAGGAAPTPRGRGSPSSPTSRASTASTR